MRSGFQIAGCSAKPKGATTGQSGSATLLELVNTWRVDVRVLKFGLVLVVV